jgi:hypothetical protein
LLSTFNALQQLLKRGRVIPACLPPSFRIFVGKNGDSLSCESLVLAKNFMALFTSAEVRVQFGGFQRGQGTCSGQCAELLIFIVLAAPGMNL